MNIFTWFSNRPNADELMETVEAFSKLMTMSKATGEEFDVESVKRTLQWLAMGSILPLEEIEVRIGLEVDHADGDSDGSIQQAGQG